MGREVPGNHLVQQLGGALDNRRTNHTVPGVSSNPGLRMRLERGRDGWTDGNHLIVDELFRRVVLLQHREELDDVGVL